MRADGCPEADGVCPLPDRNGTARTGCACERRRVHVHMLRGMILLVPQQNDVVWARAGIFWPDALLPR